MGSVQSQAVCKKCGYVEAFQDYYYKTGEVFIFCNRCGWSFSAMMVHDPKYGQIIKRQAEQLIKEGKIDEALKVTGNLGWQRSCMVEGVYKTDIPISEWSNEDKIKTIMGTSWDRYHKTDEHGNYVWDIKDVGGVGAYHQTNKRGSGVMGHFETKWGAKKSIKRMRRFLRTKKGQGQEIIYTKRDKGVWYSINLRTGKRDILTNEVGIDAIEKP